MGTDNRRSEGDGTPGGRSEHYTYAVVSVVLTATVATFCYSSLVAVTRSSGGSPSTALVLGVVTVVASAWLVLDLVRGWRAGRFGVETKNG